MLVIAMILSRVMNEDNLTTIMLTVGLGIPGILVLILAQWTTNTSNAYSSGLGLAVIFTKTSKAKLTFAAGTIGTLMAVFGIYGNFINFLSIITMFIAPIGGVYTAIYYIGGAKMLSFESPAKYKAYPLIAWGTGTLVSWMTLENPIGLELFKLTTIPSLDSFIIAFIAQGIFCFVIKRQFTKENQYEVVK